MVKKLYVFNVNCATRLSIRVWKLKCWPEVNLAFDQRQVSFGVHRSISEAWDWWLFPGETVILISYILRYVCSHSPSAGCLTTDE